MNLVALPAFADNYIWMVHDDSRAFVVDPGDAAPVIAALKSRRLQLAGILVTHHHADHVGGIDALRGLFDEGRSVVYGPAREPIPEPFVPLRGGDSVALLGLRFEVLDVPGHTAGHVAYVQRDVPSDPLLFCGDTLFSAGCGRLFEGTPAQMWDSLGKLMRLPDDTRVYCAHEYTASNARFALSVEPENPALVARAETIRTLRAEGKPTVPSTIGLEKATNPFLRVESAELQRSVDRVGADAVEIFAETRRRKDHF